MNALERCPHGIWSDEFCELCEQEPPELVVVPRYRRTFHVHPKTVKAIRDALELSQEQFAQQLGVTRRTIIRWEADGAVLDRFGYTHNSKLCRLERLAKPAQISLETGMQRELEL